MAFIQKLLPIGILSVGCSALAVQATVLHPYHEALDSSFEQIKQLQDQDKKFYEFEAKALQAVNLVDARLEQLMKLKTEGLLAPRYV